MRRSTRSGMSQIAQSASLVRRMSRVRLLSPARDSGGFSALAAACALALILAACGTGHPEATRHHPHPRETLITPEPPAVQEPKQARPNVLVIETDDMRWDDLRWMPNVRRLLQRRGLTFENSFAPYPLCCPSRAELPHGRVRPQPPRLHPRRTRSGSRRSTTGAPSRRCCRRRATRPRWWASTSTATAQQYLRRYGQVVAALRAAGLDQWLAGSDHLWACETRSTAEHLRLLPPGRRTSTADQVVPRALLHRRDGGADAAAAHGVRAGARRPGSSGGRRSLRTTAPRSSPTTRRPSLRSDGEIDQWVTPARPDWVKGRFDRPDHARVRDPADGLGRGGRQRQAALPAQAARAHAWPRRPRRPT